jgi:hypothetical protein
MRINESSIQTNRIAHDEVFTEIVVCDLCGGTGKLIWTNHSKWVKGVLKEKVEDCGHCKGSGKLLRTTTIEYTPFDRERVHPVRRQPRGL